MNFLRVIQILILGILAVPFIVINVWGLKMTQHVMEETKYNDEMIKARKEGREVEPRQPTTRIIAPPIIGMGNLGRNKRGTNEYAAFFSPTDLNSRRVVRVARHISLADVLDAGEAVPPEHLKKLYVQARAMKLMDIHCPELLETIASRCRVSKVTLSSSREGEDTYLVTAYLHYAPLYEIGFAKEGKPGRAVAAVDPFASSFNRNPPAFDRDARLGVLRFASDLCDRVREAFGQCLISDVQLGEYLPRHSRRSGDATEDAPPSAQLDVRIAVSLYGSFDVETQMGLRTLLENEALDLRFVPG